MIRKLSENIQDSTKRQVESVNSITIPKIRKYLEQIEEDLAWAEIEVEDILSGENDDLFTDSYVKDLVVLIKELCGDLSKARNDAVTRINKLD